MVILFVAEPYLDRTENREKTDVSISVSMIFIPSSKHLLLITEYCPGAGILHLILQHHFKTRTKNLLSVSLERYHWPFSSRPQCKAYVLCIRSSFPILRLIQGICHQQHSSQPHKRTQALSPQQKSAHESNSGGSVLYLKVNAALGSISWAVIQAL